MMNFARRGRVLAVAGTVLVFNAAVMAATVTLDRVQAPSAASSAGAWTFAGTGPAGARVAVQILNSPATGPLPGPLTAQPVVCDAGGNWSESISAMTSPAGSYSFAATLLDGAGMPEQASTTYAVTVDAATSYGTAVPVVQDLAITGQVGMAIMPVQVQANGGAFKFTSVELGAYGLSIDSTGTITGTPSMPIATRVEVTATNTVGTSFPAEITLNIAPGTAVANASGRVMLNPPL